jgi:hypothetical protein
MKLKGHALPTAIAVLLCSGGTARASVIIDVAEFGGDVVFNYSGSLDTLGLIPSFMTNGAAFFTGNFGGQTAIGFGVGPQLQGYEAPGLTSFSATSSLPHGRAFFGIANGSGLSLFAGDVLGLPVGYISNSPLAGSLTLANQSFDTLALIAGVYESHLPSGDFLRLTIEHSGVPMPEPDTLLLVCSAAAAIALRKRLAVRRRRHS